MFEALGDELEKGSEAGKLAAFWWRDDDAQQPSAQLDRLLEISARHRAALSLAVIPDGVQHALAEAVSGHDQLSILQHGFSHQNYAPSGERKMELGWHRPAEQILGQITLGLNELQALFSEQLLAVLVPPWNRIDLRLVERLEYAGLCGLSTLGARQCSHAAKGLQQINVHVDIINWKQGRCFTGEEHCIEQIIAHLSAKRENRADPDEPTGIMSHHLVHDAGCWKFLDDLFGFLRNRPDACVLDARKLF